MTVLHDIQPERNGLGVHSQIVQRVDRYSADEAFVARRLRNPTQQIPPVLKQERRKEA